MRLKGTILLILIVQMAGSAELEILNRSGWDHAVLNTAATVNYLSPLEKEIILEINKLRSNPAKYASSYIAPLAKNYKQKLLYYPGDKPLRTHEGVQALHECIHDLNRRPSLSLVYPDKELSKAARDHVNDQSQTGGTGHKGSDHSGFRERIERYGEWKGRIAENIAYGGSSARQIIIYLLIDDGIPGRGHRKNFLNPTFRTVGVASGSHPSYSRISVIDFAGSFTNK